VSARARLQRPSVVLIALVAVSACGRAVSPHSLIPVPASVQLAPSDTFYVDRVDRIVVEQGGSEAVWVGRFLSELIGNSVETRPEVTSGTTVALRPSAADSTVIRLRSGGDAATLGSEGYELVVTDSVLTITAASAAGLFYGVQTVRQLMPPLVEYRAAYTRPLPVPIGTIVDRTRFEWRGAMIDVARHFRTVDEVKRFVDLMALYKLNRLHLHLSDDQGWRVEIPGWPELTGVGAATQVGGDPGGYYSVDEYRDLVAYAAERFVMVVPEIDMPGHTNAALASYAELNCDGVAREPYTGTSVGFSSLCPDKEITYRFIDDVVREISANTPGPYFHIGGDEVRRLTDEEYADFIGRAQEIVRAHGKTVIGWDEIATADLAPGSLVQLWRPLWPEEGERPDSGIAAAAAELQARLDTAIEGGSKVILSPADRVYLDQKYDRETVLGLAWAAYADVRRSYDWRVGEIFRQIPEGAIVGVEAPLWGETIGSADDLEYLAFPRLAGVAELAWSPEPTRSWEDYRLRLAAQEGRWRALGVNFHPSRLVPWSSREGGR
jgi:hexosaminidase